MRIQFLGTGTSQGVPVIACPCDVCVSADTRDKRLRSSVLVETGGITLVIDTGPDFRQQMLRTDTRRLDAVLLTHGHKDHIGGLDDVRAFNYLQRRPMDIYGQSDVLEDIRREFSYAFGHERYPGVPELRLIDIEGKDFFVGETLIKPVHVMHADLPVMGFRIGPFTYITDASFISDLEMEKIKGSEVLVINALRKRKHHSHFNLEEALEVISTIRPRQSYLTHISHQMGKYEEVMPSLPPGVSLAFDGLILDL
ncbi:MAG TPA: MBL fold metallo-hydrolase [Bacteroidales bacterium]|nr:MBL fold metallo-hydrolase [Bacteroidales bacterium]